MSSTRRSASSTDERDYSGLALALQQTQATYEIALERDAAEEDAVCESVRHIRSLWRNHTLSFAGARPIVHPPKAKNVLRTSWVAKRFDPETKDCVVRLCAELHTRWQMQVTLNALSLPATEQQLVDGMQRVDDYCFFQLGRPGVGYEGTVSDWFVDDRRPERFELFALAKTPSASRACVKQLATGNANVAPIIGQDGQLLRRTSIGETYALFKECIAREQAKHDEPIFAPHFAFFAGIALMAQYDLATLDSDSFFGVWQFHKSFHLFDGAPDKSLYPLLTRFTKRIPRQHRIAYAHQLKHDVSGICTRFKELVVAYQN